ncbi:MAG: hypothetical protein WC841_04730 [Candidatus Shapirobacteria bacterium]|jgi:dTMP kinase
MSGQKKRARGKFIVIEGTDGSGKSVQSGLLKDFLTKKGYRVSELGIKNIQISLLEDYLENKGYDVKTDDYPHYETSIWGKLIGRMLTGEFGNPLNISPYLTVLPYMIDEYWGSQQIKKWVNSGRLVISNRYFTSNVHQVAKLKGEAQNKYRDWLWNTGWKDMKILKPDLVIVLLVEPEVSIELVKKKAERNYVGGKGADLVEKSIEHQRGAYDEYLRMVAADKTWVQINCCKNGKLLTISKINKLVLEEVKKVGII